MIGLFASAHRLKDAAEEGVSDALAKMEPL